MTSWRRPRRSSCAGPRPTRSPLTRPSSKIGARESATGRRNTSRTDVSSSATRVLSRRRRPRCGATTTDRADEQLSLHCSDTQLIGSIGSRLLHFDIERGCEIRSTTLEQVVVGTAPIQKHAQASDEPTSLVATKHGVQLIDPRTRDGLALDCRPLVYRSKDPSLFCGLDSADRGSLAMVDSAGTVREYAKVRLAARSQLTPAARQPALGSQSRRTQRLRRSTISIAGLSQRPLPPRHLRPLPCATRRPHAQVCGRNADSRCACFRRAS